MIAQTGAGLGFIIIFVGILVLSWFVKMPTERGRARHERKMRDDAGYRRRYWDDQYSWPGQSDSPYPPDIGGGHHFPPLPGEETPEQAERRRRGWPPK